MELSNTPALGAACPGARAVGTTACWVGSGRSSGLECELPGQLSLTLPCGGSVCYFDVVPGLVG